MKWSVYPRLSMSLSNQVREKSKTSCFDSDTRVSAASSGFNAVKCQ